MPRTRRISELFTLVANISRIGFDESSRATITITHDDAVVEIVVGDNLGAHFVVVGRTTSGMDNT